jgi:hypothetical protein
LVFAELADTRTTTNKEGKKKPSTMMSSPVVNTTTASDEYSHHEFVVQLAELAHASQSSPRAMGAAFVAQHVALYDGRLRHLRRSLDERQFHRFHSSIHSARDLRRDIARTEAERDSWLLIAYLRRAEDETRTEQFAPRSNGCGGGGGDVDNGECEYFSQRDIVDRVVREDHRLNRCIHTIHWLEHVESYHVPSVAAGDAAATRTLRFLQRHQHRQGTRRYGGGGGDGGVFARTMTGDRLDGLVTVLDPDAEAREGRRLDRDDCDDESALLAQVWRLLRAGRRADAAELCAASDQPWRAASLSGGRLYHNKQLEGAASTANMPPRVIGNRRRLLWKQQCRALATAPPPVGGGARGATLSPCERAIYGLLGGSLPEVLSYCGGDAATRASAAAAALAAHTTAAAAAAAKRVWENVLWAHLSVSVDVHVDNLIVDGVGDRRDAADVRCGHDGGNGDVGGGFALAEQAVLATRAHTAVAAAPQSSLSVSALSSAPSSSSSASATPYQRVQELLILDRYRAAVAELWRSSGGDDGGDAGDWHMNASFMSTATAATPRGRAGAAASTPFGGGGGGAFSTPSHRGAAGRAPVTPFSTAAGGASSMRASVAASSSSASSAARSSFLRFAVHTYLYLARGRLVARREDASDGGGGDGESKMDLDGGDGDNNDGADGDDTATEAAGQRLLVEYVNTLVADARDSRNDVFRTLVPLYTQYLDDDAALHLYTTFLCGLRSDAARAEGLDAARRHFPHLVADITKYLVSGIITTAADTDAAAGVAVGDTDGGGDDHSFLAAMTPMPASTVRGERARPRTDTASAMRSSRKGSAAAVAAATPTPLFGGKTPLRPLSTTLLTPANAASSFGGWSGDDAVTFNAAGAGSGGGGGGLLKRTSAGVSDAQRGKIAAMAWFDLDVAADHHQVSL